jgi:hypothetical protein
MKPTRTLFFIIANVVSKRMSRRLKSKRNLKAKYKI